MSSITRNNFSIHSNSKGNLLKTEYQKDGIVYFVKSGRLQVRDFPEKWGIEPVIEVLCYEIGKLMGLNVAEQSLSGMEGIRYGKNFRTLVCSSPDFRNGKTLIYLASLYAEDESNIDFEKLCRNTGCGNDLIFPRISARIVTNMGNCEDRKQLPSMTGMQIGESIC